MLQYFDCFMRFKWTGGERHEYPMRAHTMRSPRVGSRPKNTAGSAGVGVRNAGGRMRKHSTAASTVAGPSKNIRAAAAERAISTRKVAVGSCHESSACRVWAAQSKQPARLKSYLKPCEATNNRIASPVLKSRRLRLVPLQPRPASLPSHICMHAHPRPLHHAGHVVQQVLHQQPQPLQSVHLHRRRLGRLRRASCYGIRTAGTHDEHRCVCLRGGRGPRGAPSQAHLRSQLGQRVGCRRLQALVLRLHARRVLLHRNGQACGGGARGGGPGAGQGTLAAGAGTRKQYAAARPVAVAAARSLAAQHAPKSGGWAVRVDSTSQARSAGSARRGR